MILITEFMDHSAVETLKAAHEVLYAPELADDQAAIPALLGRARALIVRNRTQVSAQLLSAGPNLVCVGRLGVGLDNIDQPACVARGIAVLPATGANSQSVAEYVITSAMMLLRGAYHSQAQMLAGDWPRAALVGRELADKTLGLVGFGAIAQMTATRARALGMRVCAHDPFLPDADAAWDGATRQSLDALLKSADVVSLHVPLTNDTHHMIDAARLAQMKPGAVLINAARGGVVDEAALAQALGNGALGGAALDVFETEPLSAGDARKFQAIGNLLLTPHIAGVTRESGQRVGSMIAGLVLRALQ